MLGVEQVIEKASRIVGTLAENIKARLLAATDTARRFLCDLIYWRLVAPYRTRESSSGRGPVAQLLLTSR